MYRLLSSRFLRLTCYADGIRKEGIAVLQALKRREGKICWIAVEDIRPNPVQPRRVFDPEGLRELARSIAESGVLQPLIVRRRQGHYELIAGERRLRAAKLAGLAEVPCILSSANMEEASVLALIENLQRRDLNFLEEAEGISRLVKMFGMSQEEAARRLGKSQSAVANKLRLLRLPSDVLERLVDSGMSERHGRALLRLDTAERQRRALDVMLAENMNVAAAERYIDAILESPELAINANDRAETENIHKHTFVMKDLRVFYNSLSRSVELMRRGGIAADVRREETEDAVTLTIRIPRK